MQWFREECKPPFQRAPPDTSQVGPGDLCSKQDFAAVRATACSLKKWHSWAPHQPSPMSPLGNQWEKQWLFAKPQKKGSISLSTNCSSGLFQTGPLARHNKKEKKKKKKGRRKKRILKRKHFFRSLHWSQIYYPGSLSLWCSLVLSSQSSWPAYPAHQSPTQILFPVEVSHEQLLRYFLW